MKISTQQLEKIEELGGRMAPEDSEVDTAVIRLMDKELVAEVTKAVEETPDREGMVEDIRRRMQAGEYSVTADEIVDAMFRRAKADRIV